MGDLSLFLDDHHEMMRDMVREFAKAEIAPVASRYDESEDFPWENGAKMSEIGLFGIPWDEVYGGAGMDLLALCIAVEEIARIDASHSIMVGAHSSLCSSPIERWGSDHQKDRFLTPLASGQVLGGFGLTEPGSGSDSSAMRTRAEKKGDRWVLNGQKTWITHGGVGEIFMVGAVTSPDKGGHGITAFLLTKETCDLDEAIRTGFGHSDALDPMSGFIAGKKLRKLGWNASDTREIIFEDVEVPQENVLGEVDNGFPVFLDTLNGGRIGFAAHAVGIAQGALDETMGYTSEREQFNRKIRDFQGVQFMLAEIQTRIHAARVMVYHAARLRMEGKSHVKEAAMAKLFASEAAMDMTTVAVQLHGGYGYSREYPVERMMRDAKITEIGEGTSEIQKIVIASEMLKEYGRIA